MEIKKYLKQVRLNVVNLALLTESFRNNANHTILMLLESF